jgi:plasmid maintenance system antidote protein VapI
MTHGDICANRHYQCQVPIDTLLHVPNGTITNIMPNDFRSALLWHMEQHQTTITDLVKSTGVSRDIINKLKGRENSSTTVENGMLIAAFYGKTVNDFINLKPATDSGRTAAILDLLKPEERQLLEAQIRGILSRSAP